MAVPFFSDGKWGYRTVEGEVLIPPRFAEASRYRKHLSVAVEGGAFVVVDDSAQVTPLGTGRSVVPLRSDLCFMRTGAGAVLKRIGSGGETKLKGIRYVRDAGFGPLLSASDENDLWGIIDLDGRVVVDFQYRYVGAPSEGRAAFTLDKQAWGYLDSRGAVAIEALFQNAYEFRDGIALVKDKEGFGFVDSSGKFVRNRRFGDAQPFSSGVAWVAERRGGPFECVDRSFKPLFPKKYFQALPFENGWSAVARSESREFATRQDTLISLSGETVYAGGFVKQSIVTTDRGYAWVREQQGISLVTLAGVVVPWETKDSEIPKRDYEIVLDQQPASVP